MSAYVDEIWDVWSWEPAGYLADMTQDRFVAPYCVTDGVRRRVGSSLVTARPLTRLGVVGLAGHVCFELAAGVGVPLASVIGPGPAAGLWAATTRMTLRGVGRPEGAALAGLVNGFGVAAMIAHFSAWPRRRTRLGLPWLEDCEGLGADLMPAYNTILYLTAAAAVGGLLRESTHRFALGIVLPMVAAPLLAAGQRWEYLRLRQQAQRRPTWWYRRLSQL
jgi:hypothetical protein